MIKVSDYVAKRLADWGVRHVFLVTGGGAMHLNDSLGKESRLQYICMHHEQAAAMAAEGYARITNTPGVINVTTGPGGINALNGVFGAYTDSIPMLVISGQVKRETCKTLMGCEDLRQLGDQEADIIGMVRGITKYAVLVDDPASIRYHLEKAFYLAKAGRPGPCWIDVPIDVQGAMVDEDSMRVYDEHEDEVTWDIGKISELASEVLKRISAAKKPVVLAGTGVRLANAIAEYEALIGALQIPVTTAWTHDLISSTDPLFCGRPGTIGERAGNFTLQDADLVLVLGSRLNIRQVSYNWASFAPKAFKIQVDIDEAEFVKPTVRPDLAVHCDLRVFLRELNRQLASNPDQIRSHSRWLAWCRERVARYPVVQQQHRKPGPPLNPYYFVEMLGKVLGDGDVVVCGNASACIVPFQALPLKAGQRLFSNSGCASMGYDLPAAIGAAFAHQGRVVCLAGDGSIQMNIQELQTVVHYKLPIKIVVLDNDGYLSIRSTQTNFFGRLVGESPASGVTFPDMARIAEAYGIPAMRLQSDGQMEQVYDLMNAAGPSLISVSLDAAQGFEPRIRSRQSEDGTIVTPALEDMYPFLSQEELASNRYPED